MPRERYRPQEPSIGIGAHDCFARRNVLGLTIELATFRIHRLSGSALPLVVESSHEGAT